MLFIQDGKQKCTPSSKNLGTLPYQLHKTEKKIYKVEEHFLQIKTTKVEIAT